MEEQININGAKESYNAVINDEMVVQGGKWFEKYFIGISKISKWVCTTFYKKNERCVFLRFNNEICDNCGECEDCDQELSEKIIKDNYRVVREFDGNNSELGTEIFEHFMNFDDFLEVRGRNNSTFATYLTNCLKNHLKDIKRGEVGHIRAPTIAENLGPDGVKIWQLMYSEKLTLDEVIHNIDKSQSGVKEGDLSSTDESDFAKEIEAFRKNKPTKLGSEIFKNISHEDAKKIYEKVIKQKKLSQSKKTVEFNDSTSTYSDKKIKYGTNPGDDLKIDDRNSEKAGHLESAETTFNTTDTEKEKNKYKKIINDCCKNLGPKDTLIFKELLKAKLDKDGNVVKNKHGSTVNMPISSIARALKTTRYDIERKQEEMKINLEEKIVEAGLSLKYLKDNFNF